MSVVRLSAARVSGSLARWGPTASLIIALAVLWEGLSWILANVARVPLAQSRLPYVHEVLKTFAVYWPVLAKEASVTSVTVAEGFALGAFTGVSLALLMSLSRTAERILMPYATASQMVPILGLAPIIYGIVHDENVARILIAAYVTFFPVALNTLRGLTGTPPQAVELMKTYAASIWQTYWKVRLPAALPALAGGMKIAAPLSVTGAILVELMGAQHGIGVLLLRNLYYGPSHAYMFWATLITGALMGLAGYGLVQVIERIFVPWQPEFRRKGGARP
ncbi:ABC transporter permease [Kyrpidia spormannii]|uniref:ABC transporter permease n=2 Tax=Kyrpidia spormannii TaxID=2055160 RepID=A0ACA8ZDP0_9BACL|nr:ABC transporter permease [Kyrpidia spormannii]CAB3395306.1 ABC transporter permease [Kyrpidia spormannii]CAB3396079.1 ABC transporter permease [Kyrpidia spormannii]